MFLTAGPSSKSLSLSLLISVSSNLEMYRGKMKHVGADKSRRETRSFGGSR